MTPFDALRNKQASELFRAFQADGDHALPRPLRSLEFSGRWELRRYIISNIVGSTREVDARVVDHDNDRLVLPAPVDALSIVADLRSFGSAHAARARSPVWFESAIGSDRVTHLVAHHHHVARCGHKGPWPEDHFVDDPALPKCRPCAKAAARAKKISMSK